MLALGQVHRLAFLFGGPRASCIVILDQHGIRLVQMQVLLRGCRHARTHLSTNWCLVVLAIDEGDLTATVPVCTGCSRCRNNLLF